MSTSRFESNGSHLHGYGLAAAHQPQRDDDLYAAFLNMRNLLEEYAPSWYSDDLRKRVEAVEPPKQP